MLSKVFPLISVTVPAYKAQFFEECIDSILAQTYTNFELIIVNDASPHDLDSIIHKYNDKRIKYYKNEVGFGAKNVVGNWNKCLEYAKGDYVICMGDDDKLLPNCLEEYVKLLEQFPGLDIYHGWTEIIDEKSIISDINEPRPIYETVYSMIYYRMKGRQQYIGDFLFRTNELKEKGGFYNLPMAWGSDDISAYTAAIENGVANTQVPVFLYRRSKSTLSFSGDICLQMDGVIKVCNWIDRFTHIVPTQKIDIIYCNKIRELIPIYKNSRVIDTLFKDYKNNGIKNLKYWTLNRSKYGLSMTIIIKSLLRYIRGN